MRKKWGKFYARWTGADGKRHEKACPTMKKAKDEQRKQIAARTKAKNARRRAKR